MIQFARAVGLVVSLASFIMLENLLLKSRVGTGVQHVASRFPSVGWSTMVDSVAYRSVHSLPTIIKTDASNVVDGEEAFQKPRSCRQTDARLAEGHVASEKPGTDSLKTLQHIKSSEKKKSRMWTWSKEGHLNPLLTSGDDKESYVFTEEMLELVRSTRVFATGPDEPFRINTVFIECCAIGKLRWGRVGSTNKSIIISVIVTSGIAIQGEVLPWSSSWCRRKCALWAAARSWGWFLFGTGCAGFR